MKEKIEQLYEDSLNLKGDYTVHPLRVVQAAKSLIGINLSDPLFVLVEFCEEYFKKFVYQKESEYKTKIGLPQMVSYKNLEESLLKKNKSQSYKNIYCLKQVSEGTQIIEFLLEFSLKYSKRSYLFIWSIYKMMLFLNNKFILVSLFKCVDCIIDDEMISGKNNVSYNLYEIGNIEGFNVETYLVLYAIYYEELIRKDKVRRNIDLMPSNLIECNEIADFKINFNIKKNRIWIHEYIKSLSLEQIDVQLILCLDAARGAYKICEENNNDTGFISEYFKIINEIK